MLKRTPIEPQSPQLPLAPGRVTRELTGDSWQIRLDLAQQSLSLNMPAWRTWPDHEEALAPVCTGSGFVSASMLAVKAKLFDDGLYAAAEMAAQSGKRTLLSALVGLSPRVAAAARLGGIRAPESAEAERLTNEFLRDDLKSKPIGFFTWSDSLRQIFQQDRLLQEQLSAEDAAALRKGIEASSELRRLYATYLDLAARLTNPPPVETPDLRNPAGSWFLPPSRSHESELVKRLYGNRPIPEGSSLADTLVEELQAGRLTLKPTGASGWYDLQAWALEPLVLLERMPEAARLQIGPAYRRQLRELFTAIIALTRETHVKQAEIVRVGASLGWRWLDRRVFVSVEPELTTEPIPTYYERRAEGYEVVREALESLRPLKTMRRLTPDGPVPTSLDEELEEMTEIFRSAAAVARHELGMAPASDVQRSAFSRLVHEPGLPEDIRMMVPVFHDAGRARTKVWAILGWVTRPLGVSFATPPAVEVLSGRPVVKFVGTNRQIAIPIFAETYTTRLLTRDEFRAHCDRYKTRTAILENL